MIKKTWFWAQMFALLICPLAFACPTPTVAKTNGIPEALLGQWQETKLFDNSEFADDLRDTDLSLYNRVLTITPESIEVVFNVPLSCSSPTITVQHTTAAELMVKTMKAEDWQEGHPLPSPEDFQMPLKSTTPVKAMWVSCKNGSLSSPDKPENRNWIFVMPNGQMAFRWYDNDLQSYRIILLKHLPPDAKPNPSFDCKTAKTPAQKTICNSVELAALDRSMAHTYSEHLKDAEDLLQKQIQELQHIPEQHGDNITTKAQAIEDKNIAVRDLNDRKESWRLRIENCGANEGCLRETMRFGIESEQNPKYDTTFPPGPNFDATKHGTNDKPSSNQ